MESVKFSIMKTSLPVVLIRWHKIMLPKNQQHIWHSPKSSQLKWWYSTKKKFAETKSVFVCVFGVRIFMPVSLSLSLFVSYKHRAHSRWLISWLLCFFSVDFQKLFIYFDLSHLSLFPCVSHLNRASQLNVKIYISLVCILLI